MPDLVIITGTLPTLAAERLAAAGLRARTAQPSRQPARAELLSAVAGAAGLVSMLRDRIDAELLDAAGPALRVVANFAVGYENIDLQACRARGVVATNTPDVLTEATAELAWALILAAARRVGEGERLVRSGGWTGWEPTQLLGKQLTGATLGIVGAGRIGTAVARMSAGFRMRVLYTARRPQPSIESAGGATRVELDDLLAQSDIVSLHVPMRPENRHLLSRERLARMKPGSILVNTARGAVVDETALVECLRSGPLAAAGLDVYEHEPRLTPGLTDLPNAVLLPHLGSATLSTRNRMAELVADNVIAVLAGRAPLTPIPVSTG